MVPFFFANFFSAKSLLGYSGYSNPRGDLNYLWYSNSPQVIITTMSIWKTTPPTSQDYPIWAFTEDSEDVVLIRSMDQHQPTRVPVTWCRADIPERPVSSPAEAKFWVLRRSSATGWWLHKEWFLAGYDYGKHCKGKCGCDKGQALKEAKSPFVNPEEFHDREPYESAYDERV